MIDTLISSLKPVARAWVRNIPDTKTARKDAVRKAAGSRGLTKNIEAVEAAVAEIRALKPRAKNGLFLGRTEIRLLRRLGKSEKASMLSRRSAGRFGPMPEGTPVARLEALRRKEVMAAKMWRFGQNDSMDVVLTKDPAAVGLIQIEKTDWDKYRGAFKGRPCHYRQHIVTVPADWRVRVARRGLAVVDGMTTLDAAPMDAPEGLELFSAVWVVQGRGNEARSVRGYIARRDGLTFHASTAAAAISGVCRKAQRTAAQAQWQEIVRSADLAELVAAASVDATVKLSDARAIGACKYGIESWCHSTGLPIEAGEAPLRDVFAAYQHEPRPEARAAILHALRRIRALRPAA